MERAGDILRKLKAGASIAPEAVARAAWPRAVGKRVAERTRPVGYRDGCLIVEVEDAVWLQHLTTMASHILPHVQEIAGRENVRAIEFRRGVPRREPQRAGSVQSAAQDEADSIADPILRRLYIASRSKGA